MKKLLMSTAALVLLGGCQYLPDWLDWSGADTDVAADTKVQIEDAVGEDTAVGEDVAVEEVAAEIVAEPVAEAPAMADMAMAAPLSALLMHPDRPAGDAEDDAARKPAAVLEFVDAAAGMNVYELEAGAGYYTELLSRIVGPEGSVVMQNPASFDAFLGDSVEQRLAGERLANVTLRKSPFDDLDAEAGSQDRVTWFLGPHELWYTPDGAEPGSFGDPAAAFAAIAQALKPGGQFIVLDHSAPDGSPESTGGTTHRIDKAIIIAQAEAAGLTLIATSDLLANPEDDRTILVFDPAVRRKTDRFLLKFRK